MGILGVSVRLQHLVVNLDLFFFIYFFYSV